MNPLIEKYEEIYGKKEEEAPVEKKSGMERLKEVVAKAQSSGTMGDDVITLGTDCHGLGTITCGDTVIPTAQKMPGGGINLTGGYLSVSSCDSFNVLTTSQKTYTLPNETSVEQGFNKVLDDLSRGKAVVSSINAEIDQSFTGFGGQIRYTVEIVGTYP
jgi:hypothetical protein